MWILFAQSALGIMQNASNAAAQNRLSEENRLNAIKAQGDDISALNEQNREQNDIAQENKMDALRQSLQVKGQMKAQSRSVTGGIEKHIQEVNNGLGRAFGQMQATQDGRARQLVREKEGIRTNTDNRIRSMPKVNYNPMMDIASAGLSIAGDFSAKKSQATLTGVNPDYNRDDWLHGRWKP